MGTFLEFRVLNIKTALAVDEVVFGAVVVDDVVVGDVVVGDVVVGDVVVGDAVAGDVVVGDVIDVDVVVNDVAVGTESVSILEMKKIGKGFSTEKRFVPDI